MPDRFCSQCGAELVVGARFCITCGRKLAGGSARRRLATTSAGSRRFAPVVVFGSVLAAGAAAVALGIYSPVTPPAVPPGSPSGAPSMGAALGGAPAPGSMQGNVPEGHPPLEIPEDIKKTIADLRQQAEAAPNDVALWSRAAGVEYRAGQLDPSYLGKAKTAFEHVLELDPQNLDAIRHLGNIAFDGDDADTAIGFYKRYLEQKPDDFNVQTDMATMYLAKGDSDTAVAMYVKVLQAKPGFFQALYNLGIAYAGRGESAQAKQYFEQAKVAAPDDRSKAQVDAVMARAMGEPPPASGGAAPGAMGMAPPLGGGMAPPAAGGAPAAGAALPESSDPFQRSVETIFRQHQMIAPKLAGFEWNGDTVRVLVREFPMQSMPDFVRQRFTDRVRTGVRDGKQANGKSAPVTVEIVDAGSSTVMETVKE